MHVRQSDSYDSGIDPEKLEKLPDDRSSTIQSHADENVTALPVEFPASIPYSSVKTPTQPTPTAPPARRPFLSRLKTEYVLLSKRTKIAILVGIAALIVLIIGLAAGLSTRSKHSSNLPLPSNHGGPYTGDLTYYAPALGSCGITSSSSDSIVAISHLLYDAASTGSNPNANPLCGKKIRARRNVKSVDLTVVDRCVGCKATDLDTTETVFAELAEISQGRVTVEWAWLEDVPGGLVPSSSPSSTSSVNATSTTTLVSTTVPASTPLSTSSSITTTTPLPATTAATTTTVAPTTTAPPTTTAAPPASSSSVTESPSSSAAPSSETAVSAATGTATASGAPPSSTTA